VKIHASKKVQLFGALLAETVLAPVPHRHFTFTVPKMLRPYFRFHRGLIKELCRIAHRCLAEFQRTTLGLPEGTTGVVIPTRVGTPSANTSTSTRTFTRWPPTGSSWIAGFSM
jgi:hypothetical protein